MLKTAQSKVDAKNLANITLKTALADDFKFDKTFDLIEKFDTIYFSYSISMIPPWKESIQNVLENLKIGKSFYIVDFYDQHDLPNWFLKDVEKSGSNNFTSNIPKNLFRISKIWKNKVLANFPSNQFTKAIHLSPNLRRINCMFCLRNIRNKRKYLYIFIEPSHKSA